MTGWKRAAIFGTASLTVIAMLGAGDVAGAQSTTTYTYDALGRLTDTSVAQGSANGTTSAYRYDAAGNRTSTTVTVPAAPTPSPSPTPTPAPTPTPTPTPTPATTGIVANAHFTEPAIGNGQFQYGPMGGNGWYFSNYAGVQSDGSAWVFPNVSDGDGRSGFLQTNNAGITLVVSNLTVGATYRVRFKLANRINNPTNPVYVAALGNNMGVYSTPYGGWQQMVTGTFVATQSSGNLYFGGTNANGDNAASIDDIQVTPG